MSRNTLCTIIAIIIGVLLVAGGLFMCAFYNTYEFKYIIPGIICLAIAVYLGNRFEYLID